MSDIENLAKRQLEAYNASDLEAFVGCYHSDVVVCDGETEVSRGLEAFRERYRAMFEAWDFGATVSQRLVLGGHCVDLEDYWRVNPESGERSEGRVLVRYRFRDERIGMVQFLR